MATNTVKKITKKDNFNMILAILNEAENVGIELDENSTITFDSLREFVDNEIAILDRKAESAQKRAAELRVEGDALRDRIYNVLREDEYMTISEICTELNDSDVSDRMITARLTQLKKLNKIEQDTKSIPPSKEGGKTKKLSAYRKLLNY